MPCRLHSPSVFMFVWSRFRFPVSFWSQADMAVLEREHSQGSTWRGVDALLFSPKSVPTQVSRQIGPAPIELSISTYRLRTTWHILSWLILIMMKLGRNFKCAITLDPSKFSLTFQFCTMYYFQLLFVVSMLCPHGARMAVPLIMFNDGIFWVYKVPLGNFKKKNNFCWWC